MPPPNKKRDKPKKAEQALTFTIDGIDHRVDAAEIKNADELELYRQAKLTVADVFTALQSGAPFAVAGLMFLSERQKGNRPRYSALLDSVDRYDTSVAFTDAEDDAPEA